MKLVLLLLATQLSSVSGAFRGSAQAPRPSVNYRYTPSLIQPTSASLGMSLLRGGSRLPTPRHLALAYGAIGAGFAVLLAKTLRAHPMFPFQPDSASWCCAWLATTVVDYYGAALCLCGVILANEPRVVGIAWSLGCCLLGTPVCCAWIVSRLLRKGSLRLG